jgi:hypothetical protein
MCTYSEKQVPPADRETQQADFGLLALLRDATALLPLAGEKSFPMSSMSLATPINGSQPRLQQLSPMCRFGASPVQEV